MREWLDQHLVDGWHECYKWLSVQFASLTILAQTFYDVIPSIQSFVPETYFRVITVLMLLLVIIGRVKHQDGVPK